MIYFERTAFFENDSVFERLNDEFTFEVTIAWRGRQITKGLANFFEFEEMVDILEYSFDEGYIHSMVITLNNGTELVVF